MFGIFLFAVMLLASTAMSSNLLLDMEYIEDNDGTAFALLFEEESPQYSISRPGDNRLILTISDTTQSPEVEKKIEIKKFISIKPGEGPSDLRYQFDFPQNLDQIENAWFPDKRLLYIGISLSEKTGHSVVSKEGIPDLKGIRFGFKDNATRMVMNIESNPCWNLDFKDPSLITLNLEATSKTLTDAGYGPIKWLKKVDVIRQNENRVTISLQPESPSSHSRIFWMGTGNRLIMDMFKGSENMIDEVVMSRLEDLGKNKIAPADNPADGDIFESNSQNTFGSPDDEKLNVVRMKIPERRNPPSQLHVNTNHEADKRLLAIEPKFNNNIPLRPPTKASLKKLKPEEAFIFGRIEQAMDLHDYKKAILLSNQFLSEFPESALAEAISFWRGDFYYYLWEKGEKDAAEKIITAYQFAINRSPDSDLASLANIRMAHVASLTGNSLSALGYVGLVLSRKDKGDYLPLAHLTRGKIFLKMDQPEKAINDFQILIQKHSKSGYATEANFWLASYYHMMGLYEDAGKRLDEITGSNPELYLEYPEFLLLSAKNCMYLKKYALAREHLFKAVNIGHQPETADLLLARIGDTYHNEEDVKEAEKYYRMVIDYYPGSEGASIAKLRLADYFSDIHMLVNLQMEKADEPIGDLAILEKGYQLFEKKQYQSVIDSLQDLINKPIKTETRKNAVQLYYRAAELEISRLYDASRYEELINLYQQKKTVLSKNIDPEIRLLVGLVFKELHMFTDAILLLRSIKPYDLRIASKGKYFQGLSGSYRGIGDLENARKLLEENIEEKTDNIDRQRIKLLLADIYMENNMTDKAETLYQNIIKDPAGKPDSLTAGAYLNLGAILSQKKDYERAKEALSKSLLILQRDKYDDKMTRTVYMELGNVLYNTGQYSRASESFEKGFASGFGPEMTDYWEYRYKLALSYVKTGEGVKAEPLLIEISEEGDSIIQQRAQFMLANISLERQLNRLSIGSRTGNHKDS